VFCRDWTGARQYAENAIRICSDRGIAYWLIVSTMFHGRALVKCGDGDAGMATLRRGIAAYRRTGAQIGLPQLLSQLAETQLELGQLAEGQAVLHEAIEVARRNDERFWEPELWRLWGDFLRADKASEHAVLEHYRTAASVARSQDAKALELRALMSLLQLRNDADDRMRLQTLYDGFRDQHHYSDLSRARELLQ
jgi:predicted ATPase